MSEHHPDMDLIMALAAGELPPEEATRAEAGLDAEARAELAAQRAALEALEGLPRPTLSIGEQRRIRTAVRTELRLGSTPPRVARRRPARSPLARALPVLAAFASVIVVLAVALDFGDGSESEPEQAPTFAAPAATAAATTAAPATTRVVTETTASAAATTTTAAAEAEAMMEEAADAADEVAAEAEAMMVEAEAAAGVESTDRTAATTAATSTTAPSDLPRPAFDVSIVLPDDAVRLISVAIAEGPAMPFPVSDLAVRAVTQGLVCGEIAVSGSEPDDTVYFMAYGLVDGEEAEAYLIRQGEVSDVDPGAATGIEPDDLLLLTRPDCEPLAFSTP